MQISRIFLFLTPSSQHVYDWCGVGLSIWLIYREPHILVGMDSDFAKVTCTLCNFESLIQYPPQVKIRWLKVHPKKRESQQL